MENKVEFPPVLTKKDFVRRFMADEFGNRGPNWRRLSDYLEAGYVGLVHIRNKQAGGPTFYEVLADQVADLWIQMGCSEDTHYLAGMAPTDRTILQGEVRRSERGLELTYTRVAKPMRDALRESTFTTYGLSAKCILIDALNDRSLEWLYTLLDRYPDHVIEFSAYLTHWGTLPGYNTVFWEVRSY